jgi:hypothetical protein
VSADDPQAPGYEFQQDVALDKPGIVGARWWHQGLLDEERKVSRRRMLVGLGAAGGAVAAVSALGVGLASLFRPEKTGLGRRGALSMQKTYGWDFGARGVPLVFNGQVEAQFVRAELSRLAAVMAPGPGPHATYAVPTLVESLLAVPTAVLPDPEDGLPRPDAAPFRRLADVILPVVTPEMREAYAAGEAVARLCHGRRDVAVLADLPGQQAVAFAAGAAPAFEPVLLLDNWPHPHGVVPSHLTLAALAYYQPRFASAKQPRAQAPPLFVLDRLRLAAYSEESDRFDNRYYARMPRLDTLAREGVRTLLYVVASPSALPEPDDLNAVLSAGGSGDPPVAVSALALTDFWDESPGEEPPRVHYGGSVRAESGFWTARAPGALTVDDFTPGAARTSGRPSTGDHVFAARRAASAPAPGAIATVPVVVTASGLVLAAALDRRGSMNRFAGGWSG